MTIQIEDYKPVVKASKCRRPGCGAEIVWTKGASGNWLPPHEVFTLDGEEVFSVHDPHNRYCKNPMKPYPYLPGEGSTPEDRKQLRQGEIDSAVKEWENGDDQPEQPKPADPAPTPEIPAEWVPEQYRNPGVGAGHDAAMRIPFAEISQRIEEVQPSEAISWVAKQQLQTLWYRLYHENP